MNSQRWLSVAGVSFVNSLIGGVSFSGFLFTDPVVKSLGCTYAEAMRLFSLVGLVSLPVSPAIGYITNKVGTRLVTFAGLCAAALGYLLAAHSQTIGAYVATSALTGVGLAGATFSLSLPLITGSSNRSLAFGILQAVTSMGTTIGPAILGDVIDKENWRVALQWSGLTMLALIPVTFRLLPSHAKDEIFSEPLRRRFAGHFIAEIKKFFKFSDFWLPTLMQMFANLGVGGVLWLFVPYLINRGYSTHSSAYLLAATNLSSVPGSLIVGVLGERYSHKLLLIVGLSICAASVPLLLLAGDRSLGFMTMIAFVTIWGAANVVFYQLGPLLMADSYNDSQRFSFPYGVSQFLISVMSSVGMMIIGGIYDYSHDYVWAINYCCVVTAFSAIPILLSRHKKTEYKASDFKIRPIKEINKTAPYGQHR